MILAGAVLGALAGAFQWWVNVIIEKRRKRLQEREERERLAEDHYWDRVMAHPQTIHPNY